MSGTSLRGWLKREPHPVRIRATINGDERIVRVNDSRSRWRDAEDALKDATRAEALGDDGDVLRVWEDGEVAVERLQGRAEGRAEELIEIARLLEQAADRSVQRHGEAYRLAYEQQCALVKVLSDRLQQLELAWHKLLMAQAELNPEDPNSGLVAAVLAQAAPALIPLMQSMPAPPTKNGAKQ